MKRLSLYIAGQQADLNGQTLVQMNYTAEELSNPTIVKNSYSQQVTLQGTPTNNKLFGGIFQLDRATKGGGATNSGVFFNPSAKTPFVIMDEKSAIVERGYMRLDNIERKGANVAYKVTLFGGLGEFFYNLAYDEQGEKKSLASLQYLNTRSADNELDFTISASAISQAWSAMQSGATSGMWSVINFAPAYNGIPSDSLSPDKAIIRASDAGLQTSVTEDGKTYGTVDGWAFVQLEKEYTEWQTKDFRSYLQRPVISMRKIIEACCNPSNNGGFSVELDPAFFNENNPYYTKTWVTLPILNTLDLAANDGSSSLSWNENNYGDSTYSVIADTSLQGKTSSLVLSVKPKVLCSASNTKAYLSNSADDSNYIRVRLRTNGVSISDQQTTPWVSFGHLSTDTEASKTICGEFNVDSEGFGVWAGESAIFSLANVASITSIFIDVISVWNIEKDTLYTEEGGVINVTGYTLQNMGSEATYEGYLNARSGSRVTKKKLLSTEQTPADYFVSYCKMFGLQMLYAKGDGSVKVLARDTFYNGEVIDLTERIDYAQAVNIKPFVFDSKWYNFGVEYDGGQFAGYYKEAYGRDYGLQRVNTGYSFDANEKNLLDGLAFIGATEVSERSKYNLNLWRGGSGESGTVPSGASKVSAVMLDTGHTYSLYDANGDSTEIDLPTARSTDYIEYWNTIYRGYDIGGRAQFHGDDDSAEDGNNVLLFYRGFATGGILDQFQLSDDLTVMGTFNEGEPCWMLNGGQTMEGMPLFGRYIYDGNTITHSLDFGVPAELDLPDVEHGEGATIYARAWRPYISDRYDTDTKVVTCKVDFRGIDVGEHLLRKFYYFGGSWWVLNKIKNFNMAQTAPLVDCEFIKVKNKNNYTKGQSWQ